jgi:hypothetical protein
MKDIGRDIPLTIHRGTFWEGNNFILKKNCLFYNNLAKKMIKIDNI